MKSENFNESGGQRTIMTDRGFSKKGLFSLKSLRPVGRSPNRERLFFSSGGLSGSFLPNICDFFRVGESKIEMNFPTASRGECGLPVDRRRPKRLKMELKNPSFGGEGRRALFRLWVLGLCCLFTPGAVAYMGGVCLSPLEQMALFSGTGGGGGKKSYKSQIRRIKSHIRSVERGIERYEDKLDKATDTLANSLNSQKLDQPSEEAAQKIADYMAGEQSGWNCRKDGSSGSVFLHLPPSAFPSGPKGLWSSPFFSGVFGPALPLILTSTPAFASKRSSATMFRAGETPSIDQCRKFGGEVRGGAGDPEVCYMGSVWSNCERYENMGLESVGKEGVCMCGGVPCKDKEEEARRKREAARDRLVDRRPMCRKKFPKLRVTGVKKGKCQCLHNGKTVLCEKVPLEKCRERFSKLRVTGVKAGKCQCRWSGPLGVINLPCTQVEKIKNDRQSRKDAMETCREIYEPDIKVTNVVPSRQGPECYCGKMKCADKLSKCKKRFPELNPKTVTGVEGETCMCGDDPCADRILGGKLQKCIQNNRDIYPSGVTVTEKGICMCGKEFCDDLRQSINICKRKYGRKAWKHKKTVTVKNEKCYCGEKLCSALSAPTPKPAPPSVSGEDAEQEAPVTVTIPGITNPASPVTPPDPEPEDSRPVCKPWQKSDWFGRKGRVRDKPFCKKFASEVKDCGDGFKDIRNALKRLKKYKKRLGELEDSLSEAKDLQMEARFADEDEEDDTEAAGLCIQCLKDVRKITGPGPWKRVGDGLSVVLGAGLSAFGLHEARRAQNASNELLALQGFPAENNFGYNLAGLSVGYPLVAKGLYGMTHDDNVNCNRSASPYAHAYPSYPMF